MLYKQVSNISNAYMPNLKKFTEYSLIGKISVLGIEAESSNLSTLIKKFYKKIMI